MYKVIKFFTDLQDDRHPYEVGDTFPRKGVEVTPERLAELAGKDNKQGVPLIKQIEIPETEEPSETEEIPETEEPKNPARKTTTKTADK